MKPSENTNHPRYFAFRQLLARVRGRMIAKRLPVGSNREIIRWLRNGRPNPPPHSVKVRNILALADIFAIETLVETGTYRGDTIAATLERFTSIYSVEIEPRLAAAARARFHRVRGKVHLFEGDSTVLLPKIIVQLRGPAIFWLDGHYSGRGTGRGSSDTPILAEIDAIASLRKNCGDVVIVDDARVFGRTPAYPPLADLVGLLRERLPGEVRVADDSIFMLPRGS